MSSSAIRSPPRTESLEESTANQAENGAASSADPTLSLWEILGVFSTYRQDVQRYKLYKATISIIRFVCFLNLTYSIIGGFFLVLSFMAETSSLNLSPKQRQQFYDIGLVVCILAPSMAFSDILCLRGLRQWNRRLMLPWLIIYSVFLLLLFSSNFTEIWHNGLRWRYLMMLICLILLFSIWRQVRRMYGEMIYDKPVVTDISQLTTELREQTAAYCAAAAAGAAVSATPDLPPKYEDLEQPPQYVEAVNLPPETENNK